MTWQQAYNFVHNNELIFGLLASAIIITMPEKLPGWREVPEWLWEWTRDCLKTFMNFRHSGAPVSDAQHSAEKAMEQKNDSIPDVPRKA
jgi:hypothetical protein